MLFSYSVMDPDSIIKEGTGVNNYKCKRQKKKSQPFGDFLMQDKEEGLLLRTSTDD